LFFIKCKDGDTKILFKLFTKKNNLDFKQANNQKYNKINVSINIQIKKAIIYLAIKRLIIVIG